MVPHDLGDPLLSTTLLWWNAHTTPLSARWWDGFFFWPSGGAMAFSDHRLGESLIASPLQWAGTSAVAAYNVTLLATFPLCATSAHWLAFTLTGRHRTAAIAGLAFGFSPYRFAHIEHLELLAAFGMPAALAALHQFLETGGKKWLAVFAVALLLQTLCCSYYSLFFFVLLALWLAWFIRRESVSRLPGLAIAIGAVLAVVAPLALRYRDIHHDYGFTRGLDDIVGLSGDATSIVTASPLMALWGWTAALNAPERQLMPGMTIILLALCGALVSIRSTSDVGGTFPSACNFKTATASMICVAAAAVFAAIAGAAFMWGPWEWHVMGSTVSIGAPFKPLSLAFVALTVAVAATPWMRTAYRGRSTLAFYLIAAAVLFLCSFGPKPAFAGHQFLYEPPYAWLMRLGVFDHSIRVPARFAMVAILALSVGGALGLQVLERQRSWRRWLPAVVAFAVVAEAWTTTLPMYPLPQAWQVPASAGPLAAFVELPIGDVYRDVAAMYRATLVGLPTVNGYSGFAPPSYDRLRRALEKRDASALDALTSRGAILVVVDRHADGAIACREWLASYPRATWLTDDGDWTMFRIGASAATSSWGATPSASAVCERDDELLGSMRRREADDLDINQAGGLARRHDGLFRNLFSALGTNHP
jgi:hypothetical protein